MKIALRHARRFLVCSSFLALPLQCTVVSFPSIRFLSRKRTALIVFTGDKGQKMTLLNLFWDAPRIKLLRDIAKAI